jgi:hypothetical protein
LGGTQEIFDAVSEDLLGGTEKAKDMKLRSRHHPVYFVCFGRPAKRITTLRQGAQIQSKSYGFRT